MSCVTAPLTERPNSASAPSQRVGQRARLGLHRIRRLPLVHALLAALIDDALGVAQEHVLLRHAHRHDQLQAGDARRAGAVDDKFAILEIAPGQLGGVDEAGGGDDCRAVLVVVEDGDVKQLLQPLLDDKAVRCANVLEIDAAERGAEVAHRIDELVGILGVDEQIDRIDVGEALEQRGLAFHHGLCRQSAEIAESEDGRAVGDDGDEVALACVVIGRRRILRDGAHGHRHPRRISERQVALGCQRLGRGDFELAGLTLRVELQRFLIGEARLRGLRAFWRRHLCDPI